MSKKISVVVALLIVASMMLAACQPAATPAVPAPAEPAAPAEPTRYSPRLPGDGCRRY
jgi:hypothetical protein